MTFIGTDDDSKALRAARVLRQYHLQKAREYDAEIQVLEKRVQGIDTYVYDEHNKLEINN